MNKNDIACYLPNHDGECPFLNDLRDGKLRIYEALGNTASTPLTAQKIQELCEYSLTHNIKYDTMIPERRLHCGTQIREATPEISCKGR